MTTRVKRFIYLSLLAMLAPVGLAAATAQDFPRPSRPVFLAIFDLRQADPDAAVITEASAAVSFGFSELGASDVSCETLTGDARDVPLNQLGGFIECALNVRLVKPAPGHAPAALNLTLEQRAIAATHVAANLPLLRKHQSAREISTRGSEIVAVVIQNVKKRSVVRTCNNAPDPAIVVSVSGRHPKFAITETERDTQIESDLHTLIELGAKIAEPAESPVAGAAAHCPTGWTYAIKTSWVTWASAKPVALAQKRATVELKAMLPAVAPTVLAKPADPGIPNLVKEAEAYLALTEAQEAEAAVLGLFATCPPAGAARFEAAAQAGCHLRTGGLTEQLAAVDALSKMTTRARVTVLRWAVEHLTGTARDRALLALGQATPAPLAPADPKPAEAVEQTLTLISGPHEHWSISADMFVSRNTLFRGTEGKIGVQGEPAIFYVSLNFLLGDVLSDNRKWWQSVELKWLVEGSKTPVDSMGVGLGLGRLISHWGLDFDAISPFVGVTWAKAERRIPKYRIGVSLDLKTALGWVK